MSRTNPSVDEIDAYAIYTHHESAADRSARRGGWMLAIGFAVYAAVAVGLSAAGVYASIDPRLFALTVVAAMVSLVAAYFTIPAIRTFVERLGPRGLATFHVWRIAAAVAFLYYGSQGWLPATFVNLAGWGDMLAGVLAAVLIFVPATRLRITGFHLIGFADFIVAVGTGLSLQLVADPLMANIAYLPIALIPLVGVPLSGASHIAAFHLLWKQRQSTV